MDAVKTVFAATARILVLVRTNAGSAQNLAMRLHHAHLHMTPKRDSAQKSHAVCADSTMTNQNDEALSQFITEQIVTEDNNNINDAAEWASQTKRKRRAYSIQEKVEILDFAKKSSIHAASRHFGIDRNTVRDWKKQEANLRIRRLALHSAVIPGGTTKYIQAPDVCWNAPFKEAIRKLYNDWMAHGEKATTSGGNLKAPQMEVYLEWIANAWDSLPKQMIADSFLTCGITKEEKGRHDDKIHVFKPDGAIPNGLALLKQRRQEEEVLKMVEEIDLGEDESDEEIDVEVS
ncbi:hypothetical protein niasHS_015656 [Heterodera schachtii]|uniref:DDE-1 domain-containing protein n=1 Tax=Heterodera schachtii TaxID=97005 RepID=A0ABD2HVS5_HETSC